MTKALAAVGALLVLLTGCDLETDSKRSAKNEVSDSPSTSVADDPTTPPEPAPTPNPDGEYTSSCDYALGNQTYGASGYRFIGDAALKNTGNIGVVFEIRGTWFLSGGGKVKKVREVKVPAGKSKRTGLTVLATGDQIDLHQSLGYDAQTCKVVVAIVDTYGEPK